MDGIAGQRWGDHALHVCFAWFMPMRRYDDFVFEGMTARLAEMADG